jgi:hypothetical protein
MGEASIEGRQGGQAGYGDRQGVDRGQARQVGWMWRRARCRLEVRRCGQVGHSGRGTGVDRGEAERAAGNGGNGHRGQHRDAGGAGTYLRSTAVSHPPSSAPASRLVGTRAVVSAGVREVR